VTFGVVCQVVIQQLKHTSLIRPWFQMKKWITRSMVNSPFWVESNENNGRSSIR
jgi:hypothetical protein